MAKKPGRIGEADIRQAVMGIIDVQPGRQITTTKLIAELRKQIPLSRDDEALLEGRRDDRFSQIVRNIKSHQDQPRNLVHDGHLVVIPGGFRCP